MSVVLKVLILAGTIALFPGIRAVNRRWFRAMGRLQPGRTSMLRTESVAADCIAVVAVLAVALALFFGT